MLSIISPAKKLDFSNKIIQNKATEPLFNNEAFYNMANLISSSRAELIILTAQFCNMELKIYFFDLIK